MARLIVLSPHFDDAVCSVGAAIAARADAGDDIVVVTVCGVVADADRADGDVRACAIVGARAMHLGVADAPLRGHVESYAGLCLIDDDDAIVGAMQATIANAITTVAAEGDDAGGDVEVWAPLGVGAHVDHRAVYAAALALPMPVAFYEDRPYARARGAVAQRWDSLGAARVVDDVSADLPDDKDMNEEDEDDVVAFLVAVGAPAVAEAKPPPAVVSWRDGPWRREAMVFADAQRTRRHDAICAYRSAAPMLLGDALTHDGRRAWPHTDRAEYVWRPSPAPSQGSHDPEP